MKRENFWRSTFYWFSHGLIRIWLRLRFRFSVTGAERIPPTGGLILCANHASYLDPPALGCAIPWRIVHFMARNTLYSNPFGRFFFKHAQVIPIDRTRGDLAALRTAIHDLKAGKTIGIFPEGTRSPDGKLQEAKGGIGFLLAKGNVPVLPVYIAGTHQAFPRGASRFRSARISIHIGDPIPPAEVLAVMKDHRDYASVGALVMSRIAALDPALPPVPPEPPRIAAG
jgi:1-acyl-sn-glycerol-3-phosphate acyltransferase